MVDFISGLHGDHATSGLLVRLACGARPLRAGVCILVILIAGFLFPAALGQTFEVVFSDNAGVSPYAALTRGSDGNFYGTTRSGGASGEGTVFKVETDGTLTTLSSFNSANGAAPEGTLAEGEDGAFYGTTVEGGSQASGTVFKLTREGRLTTLVTFTGSNGRLPLAGLLRGTDGNFYGTSFSGGANGQGTVFKVTSAGTLTTLVSFRGSNGASPKAGLMQGSDGNFYGTTSSGGASGKGTVFKLANDGTLTTLGAFNGTNGANPQAALMEGSDGSFYGTTYEGGADGKGTVFKVTNEGTLITLVSFNGTNGASPRAALVQGGDGNYYGTTAFGGAGNYGTVFKVTSDGMLTTLVSFDPSKGAFPYAGLTLGTEGEFYGVTAARQEKGNGTVFRMTGDGTLTTLATFDETAGRGPKAGLMQATDGNFYGTAERGGEMQSGTVFKVTAGGALTTLASFDYFFDRYRRGAFPKASLIQGRDGRFYGTTSGGGQNLNGTVFSVASDGGLTTLVSFNGANGAEPTAELEQGSDGDFYGTTGSGGANNRGTVFRVTPQGALTTLVSFDGTGGAFPTAGLVLGDDGNFYGTASAGGANSAGTVFKVTPQGTLTTLASFSYATTGRDPRKLLLGDDGNFYGTTNDGGANGRGTVFKLTKDGVLTTLVAFDITNGANPVGGLVQGSDGCFYGTTRLGGVNHAGTIFKITSGGALTTLHSFDSTTAAYPYCTPTFGRDGNLYGTAAQMTIWRLLTTPTVTSGEAQGVSTAAATLAGSVNPNGADTDNVTFEYGTTTAYGSTVAGTPGVMSGTNAIEATALLTGLAPHTLYHFRLKATNVFGTTYGQDRTFTTANTAPTAESLTANVTTGDSKVITLPFSKTDLDGDPVTVQSISVSEGAPFALGAVNGDTVEVLPRADAVGNGTISFTVSDGFDGTASGTVEVTVNDNDAPVIGSPAGGFAPRKLREGMLLPDYIAQAHVSDMVGVTAFTQSPAAGVATSIGDVLVTLTASDAAGNQAQTSFVVRTTSTSPVSELLASTGAPVAGAGEPETGVPAGAVWMSLGVPCATQVGDVVFQARMREGNVTTEGIMLQRGKTGTVSILARVGDPVPELSGQTFASFKDPLASSNPNGQVDVIFLATIAGPGVTGANNKVVCRWSEGDEGQIEVLGRTTSAHFTVGEQGFQVAAFYSLGLAADGTLWADVALVQRVRGVSSVNDKALLSWSCDQRAPRIMLREGSPVRLSDGDLHYIKTISTLATTGGSPGHGRWTGLEGLGMRISFTDGTTGIFVAETDAYTLTEVARKRGTVVLVGRDGNEATRTAEWASFGVPALDAGSGVTFVAHLASKMGGVTAADAEGIFRHEPGSAAYTVIARRGEETNLGSNFFSFMDPVSNGNGEVAFLAKERHGKKVSTGLWSFSTPVNGAGGTQRALRRITALGESAPGTDGAEFERFISLALPDGKPTGPILVAKLKQGPNRTVGAIRTTSANSIGLWAVNSTGALELLLRNGFPLPGAAEGSPDVRNFSVLGAVSGSLGQARAYNNWGEVLCLVTFSNRSTAIVKLQIP